MLMVDQQLTAAHVHQVLTAQPREAPVVAESLVSRFFRQVPFAQSMRQIVPKVTRLLDEMYEKSQVMRKPTEKGMLGYFIDPRTSGNHTQPPYADRGYEIGPERDDNDWHDNGDPLVPIGPAPDLGSGPCYLS